MSIVFPVNLDNFTNPSATNTMDESEELYHDVQHSNVNDAIEALEAKVGVDGSTVATSIDYLLKSANNPGHTHSNLSLSGVLPLSGATMSGDITFSNTQTFPASKLSITSQASGDILYASSSTAWSRLPKGSDGQILKLSSGIPAWGTADITINATLVNSGNDNYVLFRSGGKLFQSINFQFNNAQENLAIGGNPISAYALSLNVTSSTRFPMVMRNGHGSGNVDIVAQNDGSSNKGKLGWGNASSASFANSFYVGSISTDPFLLISNNTERARIHSGGEISIGTSTATGFVTIRKSSSGNVFVIRNTGDSATSLEIDDTGKMTFTGDTTLYRSAADTLKTDDSLIVGGNIAFFNGTPATKSSIADLVEAFNPASNFEDVDGNLEYLRAKLQLLIDALQSYNLI